MTVYQPRDAELEALRWCAAIKGDIAMSGEPPEAWLADFTAMTQFFVENPIALDEDGSGDAEPFLRWAAVHFGFDYDAMLADLRREGLVE